MHQENEEKLSILESEMENKKEAVSLAHKVVHGAIANCVSKELAVKLVVATDKHKETITQAKEDYQKSKIEVEKKVEEERAAKEASLHAQLSLLNEKLKELELDSIEKIASAKRAAKQEARSAYEVELRASMEELAEKQKRAETLRAKELSSIAEKEQMEMELTAEKAKEEASRKLAVEGKVSER